MALFFFFTALADVFVSYGEKGWEILMSTLKHCFPTPFLEDNTGLIPANWTRVIEFVLLPEVTYQLISQDLGVSVGEAVEIVIESETFGKYAHPSHDERNKE